MNNSSNLTNKLENKCMNREESKVVCLNCGKEFDININEIKHDELGNHVECKFCNASFDIDDNILGLHFKIFIYHNQNIDSFVAEKAFNYADEIEDMLNTYEGYWCRIIRTKDLSMILEGAFDDSFLDEYYYSFE